MAALSNDEIARRLEDLEGWGQDGDSLRKQFQFDDFKGSIDFVNRLTAPAEEMNHHPDLTISWNKVGVTITTHAAGGLTANDFELASRIDAI